MRCQVIAWFGENAPSVTELTLADAPAAMDKAIDQMTGLLDGMSDEDFASKAVSVEGMGDWTTQTWLLNTACKFVPSYKLMLFHHAKAAGNTEIGTWDAWMDNGDVPKPVPA